MILPARRARIILALCAAALLAACANKAPEGQVVATVDGEEVTRRELAVEPDAARLGQGSDRAPLAAVLSGVIDRKLAVAEARRLELDRTPDYVAQSNRLEEVLLSRTLFDRWASDMPKPDKRAVAEYIARNPLGFAQRKLFLVDRIEAAAKAIDPEAIAPFQTNDAVAAYLQSHSRPFQRQQAVLDTATLPAKLSRQLAAAAPGYPLALEQGGRLLVLAVVQSRDAALPAAEQTERAGKALMQLAVQQKLAELRRKAAIAYQPGYRPVEPASAPAPARDRKQAGAPGAPERVPLSAS